jgi:diphosphomevalonate decarboxylase
MITTAIAHANIALIKYWGKRNSSLNLPAVGSISITLKELFTKTTIDFREDLKEDTLVLNDQSIQGAKRMRISRFLDLFRTQAKLKTYAEVISHNNFPTGAGLASSASAFAALTKAASGALSLDLDDTKLSELARQGSGSAARSIYGGFVEMKVGNKPDGSDAVAVPLYPEEYWPLEVLICITTREPKDTGSTDGMNLTAQTSPFYPAWIESNADDLEEMRCALKEKDFQKLGELSEYNCLKMHGLAMSANPGLLYWNSITIKLIREVRLLRQKGIPAYFTIDAGPQVKILSLPGYASVIKKSLVGVSGIRDFHITSLGPAAYYQKKISGTANL